MTLRALRSVLLTGTVLLLAAGCTKSAGPSTVEINVSGPSAYDSLAEATEEWVRVTVRGPGLSEPLTVLGRTGTSIQLSVPSGDSRVFEAELFADSAMSTLTHTGQSQPVNLVPSLMHRVRIDVSPVAKGIALTRATIRDTSYFTDSSITVVPEGLVYDGTDEVTYRYQWYVNQSPVEGAQTETLTGAAFAKNDTVFAEITPSAGRLEGDSVRSNEVTILNAGPRIASARILPLELYWYEEFGLSVEYDDPLDPDGDDVVDVRIRWRMNGVHVDDFNNATSIPATNLVPGDRWTVEVSASDGEDWGAPAVTTRRLEEWVALGPNMSAGTFNTCYVTGFGSVECWGNSAYGQLTTYQALSPIGVPQFEAEARKVAVGYAHICVLNEDGSVYCWGDNRLGQAGAADGSSIAEPQQVASLPGGAIDLWAGDRYTCALLVDDSLHCWGLNTTGQLGGGFAGPATHLPVAVAGLEGIVQSLALGDAHACALLEDGRVQCWGDNSLGQTGKGSAGGFELTPVMVNGVSDVIRVASGRDFSCAMGETDQIWCWGLGDRGQLGRSSAFGGSSATPVQVVLPSTEVMLENLVAGESHACTTIYNMYEEREIFCWGANHYRQLGSTYPLESGQSEDAPEPIYSGEILWDSEEWATLASGRNHVCAFFWGEGEWAECWGYNAFGQGRNGQGGIISQPEVLDIWPTLSVTAGREHGCVMPSGGYGDDPAPQVEGGSPVLCWGANDFGQLGYGDTMHRNDPPMLAPVSLPTASSVHAGGYHTCAITEDSGLYCWGRNDQGQAGTNMTNTKFPVQVASTETWTTVSPGLFHTCAIRSDGSLHCWGRNNHGQLGVSGTSSSWEPVQVLEGKTNWRQVSAGDNHNCAVDMDNALYCWGNNDHGQLGNGTSGDSQSTPVAIASPPAAAWDSVYVGAGHTCAVLATEGLPELYCWGKNDYGQVGDGSQINRSNPTLVAGSFTTASLGLAHTCAVDVPTGELACWGRNTHPEFALTGQLGIGPSPGPALTPVSLIGPNPEWSTGWEHVAAGGYHTCAIPDGDADLYCWGLSEKGQSGDWTSWLGTGGRDSGEPCYECPQ